VVLVCATFGVFAMLMMMIAIVGPRSQRIKRMVLTFTPPTKRDVARVIKQSTTGAVRVVGRVDAGLEPGATVLDEQWGEDQGSFVRFFEGSSFVVVPDEGAPVVVELSGCPVILAHYAKPDDLAVPGIGAVNPLGRWVLRQGERVEVIASESHPGTHPALQSSAALAPYREAEGTSTAVTSKPTAPVVIRSLDL
jgi:hypothetical protein